MHTHEWLYRQARLLDIVGRSRMSGEELEHAVDEAERRRLERKTLDELHDCARALDVEGRSHMSRGELICAIQKARHGLLCTAAGT